MLLEGGPHVLGAFPEQLRDAARESLERLGVEVRTGSVVTDVDADGVTGDRRTGRADRRADRAVGGRRRGVAAGEVARRAARSRGRVVAEPTLAVPGHPEIFVVGDLCALQQDGKPLPGVAQVAMQQGAHAARNILRAIDGEPLEPFRYRDYGNMATIGRGSAVADIGPAQGLRASSRGCSGCSCTSSG